MTQRLLSPSKLYGTLEALRISLQAHSGWQRLRPLHHEPVAQRNGRAHRGDLRISSNHGNQMCLCLSGRIRRHLPDETVEMKLDAGRGFFRALYVSQRAEAKVGVFHSPASFFSWVST